VLAAGGIRGRAGVAAALYPGAVGALAGTRFQATAETLADPAAVKAIIEGSGDDTERNTASTSPAAPVVIESPRPKSSRRAGPGR
jgi:NAD(P)H-dependent flavin oxidoreductase YrpB (nitropropane dioxygenase family)